MAVKITLLVAFFVTMATVGVICSKRIKNVGDFVLAGRSVGPWLTAFAYGTSYFSAVVFVGYAGQFGWNFGVAATWIGIGNAFIGSLLAWLVLGKRTRLLTQHLDAATMPAFFEKRYFSRTLKIAASVIIFVFLVPYTASIYKGLSALFSMAFHLDFVWCVVGMAVLTGIYVILGGYMATAINDFIQGIVMLVGIVAVIASVLNGKGGFTQALIQLAAIPSTTAATQGMQGAYVSFFGADPMSLLGVTILTSLGVWGMPQMIHKFYVIKDTAAIKKGMIISTVFALIIAGGSYFMGAFGKLYVPATATGASSLPIDEIVPAMLSAQLSDLLIGIAVVLVLSASMSTLSALIITSSSTFTLDFLRGTFVKKLGDKTQMVVIRVCCALFIIISVVIALNPNSLISSLMSVSWGALAGAFLPPLLYGLYWKKSSLSAVWASFATGISITLYNMVWPFAAPTDAGALAMIVSLIVFPLVTLISKKPQQRLVDAMFDCYTLDAPVPSTGKNRKSK